MNRLLHSEVLSKLGWLSHGFSVGAAEVRDLVDMEGPKIFPTHQVHGNTVHLLDDEEIDRLLNGDAFVASKPGLVCSVRTADCVPILLADTKRRAVGAVHAGWRGTTANVVGKALAAMRDSFGTKPHHVVAAIGPRICGSCYEVGGDVVEEMERLSLEGRWLLDERYVDLGVANAELLAREGVAPENVELIGSCTSCDDKFVSWRRDRSEGRQVSFILRLQN